MTSTERFRSVAQLVEQRSPKPQVVGSSPSWPAKIKCKVNVSKQIKTVANAKEINPILDYATWMVLSLLVIGFVMFSQFNKMTGMAIKLGYSIVAFAICMLVYSFTAMGRETLNFAKLSRIEFLKIVWPNQQEASRMTMMVVFAVAVLALLLWLLDAVLFWLVRLVTG